MIFFDIPDFVNPQRLRPQADKFIYKYISEFQKKVGNHKVKAFKKEGVNKNGRCTNRLFKSFMKQSFKKKPKIADFTDFTDFT